MTLLLAFLCGWVVLANLGNWGAKSSLQVFLALSILFGACGLATCELIEELPIEELPRSKSSLSKSSRAV